MAALDRGRHLGVGARVAVVARDHGEARGESTEHLVVDRLARVLNGLTGVGAQLVVGPLVPGDSHNGAGDHAPDLEPVEGAERHLLGQVAGDAEDHEDVGGGQGAVSHLLIFLLVPTTRGALVPEPARIGGVHRRRALAAPPEYGDAVA